MFKLIVFVAAFVFAPEYAFKINIQNKHKHAILTGRNNSTTSCKYL